MNHGSLIKHKHSEAGKREKVSKSRVLGVALELYSSKGYSATKMVEIARGAGISVGALYLRFNSKEEICLELIKDQTRDYDEFTRSVATANNEPLHSLRNYIRFCLEYAFKRKQLITMLYREHKLPFIQPLRDSFFRFQLDLIKEILNAGIKQGSIRPLDTDDTALMIFASIRGTVMLKLIFEAGLPASPGDSLFNLLANGIRGDVK